jgi:adenylate cyclase
LGNRVRVTAQLVECDSDSCIWAENYDRELEDIFAVQDDLTRTVASTIPGLIQTTVLGRAERASFDALQAYDLLLRARRHLDAFTKADSAAGKKLLKKALQLDRTNPRMHAALANFHQLDWLMHWVMEGDASLNEAYRLSKKAVELDPTDCFTQWTLGCTYLFRRQFERSKLHFDKALELNPHDVESLSLMGLYYTYIGQPDRSLSLYEEAKKVDPHHLAWLPWYYGFTYYSMSRFNDAVDALEPIEQPNLEIMAILAGCYAHTGRQMEAEEMLRLFLDSAEREMVDFPGRSATAIFEGWHTICPYKDDSDRKRLVIGLQKAGLPD